MNAYLIRDLSVNNFESFREYIEKTPAFTQKHGGRYVVQGVESEIMEGDWNPERIVVIQFPSKQKAGDFLGDPDAQTLFNIGAGTFLRSS